MPLSLYNTELPPRHPRMANFEEAVGIRGIIGALYADESKAPPTESGRVAQIRHVSNIPQQRRR